MNDWRDGLTTSEIEEMKRGIIDWRPGRVLAGTPIQRKESRRRLPRLSLRRKGPKKSRKAELRIAKVAEKGFKGKTEVVKCSPFRLRFSFPPANAWMYLCTSLIYIDWDKMQLIHAYGWGRVSILWAPVFATLLTVLLAVPATIIFFLFPPLGIALLAAAWLLSPVILLGMRVFCRAEADKVALTPRPDIDIKGYDMASGRIELELKPKDVQDATTIFVDGRDGRYWRERDLETRATIEYCELEELIDAGIKREGKKQNSKNDENGILRRLAKLIAEAAS